MAPEAALIVVLPGATPVANPAALIVPAAGVDDVQVTELVRFCVLESLYVPVAVNCCVPATTIEGLAGVTAIVTRTGTVVTVSPVEPVIDPETACIVVPPAATPLAKPALVMVANPVFVELQVTELLRFCVLLSLYVP